MASAKVSSIPCIMVSFFGVAPRRLSSSKSKDCSTEWEGTISGTLLFARFHFCADLIQGPAEETAQRPEIDDVQVYRGW